MRTRWTQWIGYAAAAWSLLYGLLGLYWALGGAGFPFGVGDPELRDEGDDAIMQSLLGWATPEVAGPVIAVLGLAGAGAGVAMARRWSAGPARWLLPAFAWTVAIGLTVLIQDSRALITVAYLPIMVVGKLFSLLPEEAGWGALLRLPRLNLLLCMLAGFAWALTAVAYRRAVGGACTSCGRDGRPGSTLLQRWGKPAAWVAFGAPLIYCVTRWAWALGFSLGIDPEFYREGQENGLWLAGAALATMGALGSVLTLGLFQRWGEIFPRWMIGLRGKRVPPMLAVIPATFVALLVTSAGIMYIRAVIGRGLSASTWPLILPETLWVLWGAGLFVAAMAYHQRRRGACDACGRGVSRAANASELQRQVV